MYVTPAHQFPLGVTMTLRRRWLCSNGRDVPALRSSKMITTANTATRVARFLRCKDLIGRAL